MRATRAIALEEIGTRIVVLRGQRVLLDSDLARLYGVNTARLNEQVKRNIARFPSDFLFRLEHQELTSLKSQIAISKNGTYGRGGTRKLPLAFTEHGALMAANVLRSRRAIQVSVFVKLEDLERKTAALDAKHDALADETRSKFMEVIAALRRLMSTPEPTPRPIGFVTPRSMKS